MKKTQGIVEQQNNFFNTNETKSLSFRIEQLKKFKKIIKANETILYEAIYDDFGKSEYETYLTEIAHVYHETNVFIKNLKNWSKRKRVKSGMANFPGKSYILPEPLGSILVIGAWNYPYLLSLIPAVTALAAGNTVVLKPSELPTRTSTVLSKIINQNFSPEYFCVVEGGVTETSLLLEMHFDKIFFTGSIPVGRIVYQAAAKNLTPVTLELGGKSPTFVLADCDIKTTAKRIVWAKFLNAGQTCVAPDYILVDKSIETEFLHAIKQEVKIQHRNAHTLPENYVQIINQRNFDRLVALIDSDKIIQGGTYNCEKRTIEPTILGNVSWNDKIMNDEIFGPILPIISYSNLDEAIMKVKKRSKPLSCYIYSKNRKNIKKILHEVSFGSGAINESVVHLSNSNLPFGGVGYSGIGNYHGKAGFDSFSHFKSILEKPFWFEPPMKHAPYNNWKMKIIKLIFE